MDRCKRCDEPLFDDRFACTKFNCRWCDLCKIVYTGFDPHMHCQSCGSPPSEHELVNYCQLWRDGKIYCKRCNKFVRSYDAG